MTPGQLLQLRTTALSIIIETVDEANDIIVDADNEAADLRFQLSVIKTVAETALRPEFAKETLAVFNRENFQGLSLISEGDVW